jgi:hypothetical protein
VQVTTSSSTRISTTTVRATAPLHALAAPRAGTAACTERGRSLSSLPRRSHAHACARPIRTRGRALRANGCRGCAGILDTVHEDIDQVRNHARLRVAGPHKLPRSPSLRCGRARSRPSVRARARPPPCSALRLTRARAPSGPLSLACVRPRLPPPRAAGWSAPRSVPWPSLAHRSPGRAARVIRSHPRPLTYPPARPLSLGLLAHVRLVCAACALPSLQEPSTPCTRTWMVRRGGGGAEVEERRAQLGGRREAPSLASRGSLTRWPRSPLPSRPLSLLFPRACACAPGDGTQRS